MLVCALAVQRTATSQDGAGAGRPAAPLPAPGASVRQPLAAGRWDRYRAPLLPGQCLELRVVAGSLDLVVALTDASGRRLALANNDIEGSERVRFIGQAAGEHEVAIGALGSRVAGDYELSVVGIRDATEEDRAWAAAQASLATAWQRAEPDPGSPPPSARPADEEVASVRAAYREALARWEALGDPRAQAATWHRIGRYAEGLRDAATLWEARDAFRRAFDLSRLAGEPATAARHLVRAAEASQSLGEPAALEEYREALALLRPLGDAADTGLIHNNLCVLLRTTGAFDEAVEECRLTLEEWNDGGQAEAFGRMNLGAAYAAIGDSDTALDHYRASLPLWRRAGNRHMEALALVQIGMTLVRFRGDVHGGLDQLQRAHERMTEAGEPEHPMVLAALGEARLAGGDHTLASALLERASQRLRATGERVREAAVLVRLGHALAAGGELERARESQGRALAMLRRSGDRPAQAEALRGLARLARTRGRLDEARSQLEEALAILETLRSGLPDASLRELYLSSVKDYYDLYTDVLMQLEAQRPGEGLAELALAASELGRARTLVELLRAARIDVRGGVSPELLDRQRRVRQRVALKTELAQRARPDAAEALRKELGSLLLEERDVEAEIRRARPGYGALMRPERLDALALLSLLGPDDLLLEFSLGADRSYLWAATSAEVKAFPLAPRAEIEALAARLHAQWSAGGRREQARQARWTAALLSERILGPVAHLLGRRRLIVVADGVLAYLPFAALPRPGAADERPLLRDHEVVGLPSLSVLRELRRGGDVRPAASGLVAVLADPVLAADDVRVRRRLARQGRADLAPRATADRTRSAGPTRAGGRLERLPFTRREAEAIAALAPGRVRAALDFDASRELALGGSLSRYRFLHFATHGIIDSRRPELSAIVLSLVDAQGNPQDGLLRLQDVYGMKLEATDLVVLSACSTALGKQVRGEGLVGLTRGFMYAGAPRVVASLWDVRDHATAELMRRFYEGLLRRNERPAAALRVAQLSMLREPRWSSPHYWAPFVLQGDWR